jgi:hypothetical protein
MLKGRFERSTPAANKILEFKERDQQTRRHRSRLRRIAAQVPSPPLTSPPPTFRSHFLRMSP